MKPIMAAILSISSTSLTDNEKFLLERTNPVGITLFNRNIKDKNQLKKLNKEIKEVIGREDTIIAVDQEGGRVRRLKEPEFRNYSSQIELGSLPRQKALIASKLHAQLIASDLKEVGINLNYAPCLDLLHDDSAKVLASRCLSSNKDLVSELGKIMIDTYLDCGIIPCIKHLPGMGKANMDPHLELPIIDKTLQQLQDDFMPFKNNRFCPAGLTAHIVVPSIDNKPVTISKKAIDIIIRKEIGFDGFLISDAIDMHALSGSIGEKTKASLAAGCDVVCYCFGNYDELLEVEQNCSFLDDKSLERFNNCSKYLTNTNNFDLINAEKEYNEIVKFADEYLESYDATETINLMRKGEK